MAEVALNDNYWMQYGGSISRATCVIWPYNPSHPDSRFAGFSTIDHGSDVLAAEALPSQWLNFYPNSYAVFTANDIQICECAYEGVPTFNLSSKAPSSIFPSLGG
jgi:hypothetical protein